MQVFLSSLTVPFLFGAARGLAGDERLAGELDLLVVARRRDDIARRGCDLVVEAATRGFKPGEQAPTALSLLYSATNHTH